MKGGVNDATLTSILVKIVNTIPAHNNNLL